MALRGGVIHCHFLLNLSLLRCNSPSCNSGPISQLGIGSFVTEMWTGTCHPQTGMNNSMLASFVKGRSRQGEEVDQSL